MKQEILKQKAQAVSEVSELTAEAERTMQERLDVEQSHSSALSAAKARQAAMEAELSAKADAERALQVEIDQLHNAVQDADAAQEALAASEKDLQM